MTRLSAAIGVFVGALVLPPLVVPFAFPWSEINCQHQEINIKTGQARYSRWIWFVKVSERIEETPLSRVLTGQVVDVAKIEAWHRANTFSPGVHYSPHYVFHSALSQAGEITLLQKFYGLNDSEAVPIAIEVLTAWQTNRSDHAASRVLRAKEAELDQTAGARRAVGGP